MTTIKCNFCSSVIENENVMQAIRESDFHLQTAHPGVQS